MTPPMSQGPPNPNEPHSGLPLAVLRPIATDTNLSECGRCGAVVPTFAAWGTNTHSQWHDAIENTPPNPTDPLSDAINNAARALTQAWRAHLATKLNQGAYDATVAMIKHQTSTPPTPANQPTLAAQLAHTEEQLATALWDLDRCKRDHAGLTQGETNRLRSIESALIELGAPDHSTRDDPSGPMIVWATDTVVERDNLRRQLDVMRRERDHLGQQLADLRDTAVTLPDDWRDQLATVLNDADHTGTEPLLDLEQLLGAWHTPEVQATPKPDKNLEQPAAPDQAGPPSPEDLSTLLALINTNIPPEQLAAWTPAMRRYAGSWAALVHLAASDNNVTVPTRPPWLDGGCTSTWRDGDVVCVVEGEHLLHRSSADETSHHFVWSSNVDDAAVAQMTPDQQRLTRALDKLIGPGWHALSARPAVPGARVADRDI